MTTQQAWRLAVTSGLSLINFTEQNLDGKELQVVVDGWVHWARSNCPPDLAFEKELAALLNNYSAKLIEEGGTRLESHERVIESFKSLQT